MDELNSNEINCTGVKLSLANKRKMLEAVKNYPADIAGDQFLFAKERIAMTKEAAPVGSVGLFNTDKEINKEVVQSFALLTDKLGERLAYERSGVRFYEAALAKVDAFQRKEIRKELIHIKEEELEHLDLIIKAIKKIGGDPTEMTPCADISGVIGQGFMQVLSDPRTSIPQMLNTLLAIELTDNAGWELLVNLALKNEQNQIAKSFQTALAQEEEHLTTIKLLLEKEFQLTKEHVPTK